MKKPPNLRNIGIVAHVDAGKTTITEHMLYESGRIRMIGSVDRGTAHTDWLEVERERGISVLAAATSFNWKGVEINLIDTPGHVDFAAEVERALRVLDGAILVVSAVEGVQAQTEILWKALRAMNIPTIIFINKIDRIGADVNSVLSELRAILSPDILLLQAASGEGTHNLELTDVLSDNPMIGSDTKEFKEKLIERFADEDDRMLEAYLSGKTIPVVDLKEKLKVLTESSRVYPALLGSAIKGAGISELLDAVIEYLPSPSGDSTAALSGVVFKLGHDRAMGRVAYVRLFNGSIKNRDMVYNHTQNIEEKVSQIRKVYASKYEDAGNLNAGDIGGVCGFGRVSIGDILGNPDMVPPQYHLATPLLLVQAIPVQDSDYIKLTEALQELADEDPLLDLQWLKDERELHVKIMGVIQLEVLTSLLKTRFGLEVVFGKPSVIYKETPAKCGEGFVSYTMPKPCWAVLRFSIEPGERGSGIVYSSQVRDDKIMYRYQHQVQKTIPDALKQGLYGWEVTDARITLIDGEHHIMHTHPLDFIVATPMAIMDGLVNTETVLLEPVLDVKISAPEDAGGKVLHDIIQMRGSFDSPTVHKGMFYVEGVVPVATSLEYPVRLSSMTGGRGSATYSFNGYRECPADLGKTRPYRGINPLDRSKYILFARSALGH